MDTLPDRLKNPVGNLADVLQPILAGEGASSVRRLTVLKTCQTHFSIERFVCLIAAVERPFNR